MVNRNDASSYRLVGRVLRPHGIRGEFIVYLESDFPEWLAKRHQFFIEDHNEMIPWPVEHARFDGKRLIIKVAPLTDRSTVESHRDTLLYLPEDEASQVAADPDFFFNSDLVGCEVYDSAEDRMIGVVQAVLERPAQNILEVNRDPAPPLLIPFVQPIVGDISQGRIEVQLPKGLEACFDAPVSTEKTRSRKSPSKTPRQ